MMTARELEVIRKSAKTFNAMGEAMSPIYVFELLAHVDEQAGQIATLKEIIRMDRLEYIDPSLPDLESANDIVDEQLAQEYPEIFGDDTE